MDNVDGGSERGMVDDNEHRNRAVLRRVMVGTETTGIPM